MAGVAVKARVLEKRKPMRTRTGRILVEVVIGDSSGVVVLTLWGRQIDLVKENDVVVISGAFVKSFRGEPRLSLGRRGRLEVVEDPDFPTKEEILSRR